MRRGVNGLEDFNGRDELACLLLRVIAELSPCTTTSLLAQVSRGKLPSDSHTRNLILDALLKLEILDFIQSAEEQIAITDEGRRFLGDSPAASAQRRSPYFEFAGARVAALIAEYTPQLKRFCQDRLTEARAVMQQAFHGGRARDITTQLWSRKIAPTIESRVTILRHILMHLTRLCRAHAEAWAIVLLKWRRQSGRLWKAAKASSLPSNAKLAARGQLVILVGALVVMALSTTGVATFLLGKRAESSQDALTVDRSDRSNSLADTIEPDGTATLITPTALSDVDREPLRTTATEPGAVEQDPTDLPVVAPLPKVDPIVATIRLKLADSALRKGASSKDLAGLDSFYREIDGPPLWVTDLGLSAQAQAVINEIEDADDWGLDGEAFGLPPAGDLPSTAEAQANDEIKLSLAILKYARLARGGRLTPARVSVLFDQRPDLVDPKTVLNETAAASSPAAFLRSLHPQHEQFERLRQALLKARAKAQERGKKADSDPEVQRLIVNMERWRWMPRELGSTYVWNNIPEFNARVIKRGKTIYEGKTIVGQLKYATPIFSASMRSIVFHPDWTVPETVIEEDLQPALQRGGFFGGPSTQILYQHNLKVSQQGRPVDADTVDWTTVNVRSYTFTQPPGPDNVLGALKFNFPNKHAVYMHDTVQPELFAETVRTLSHGCIRVHQPDRLAAVLLAEDKGWSAQQVKSLLARDASNVVKLNRPMPVHLIYFTAVVDEKGKVETFPDVYGLDNRMGQALFGKVAKFQPAPVIEAKAQGGEPRRRNNWHSGNQTGSLAEQISRLFGN
jgi:murein L,D-transpeptidase YcbB/YkuD